VPRQVGAVSFESAEISRPDAKSCDEAESVWASPQNENLAAKI
jgi:hypothetical protein